MSRFDDVVPGDCAQTDPELWHPGPGQTLHARAAKRICGGCPHRLDCLQYALDNGEQWGIWGGLSERQRRKLRRSAA